MGGGILEKLSGPPNAADAVSVGGTVAVLFDLLPGITALLGAAWFILRLVISWQEHRNVKLEHRIKQQEFEINERRLRNE